LTFFLSYTILIRLFLKSVESIIINKNNRLRGTIYPPGDKSISHRAIIFGSLARGKSKITNFCPGDDTLNTLKAFQSLGITIEGSGTEYTIGGKGLKGLHEPSDIIDAGNSGTTTRLLTGLLGGQNFFSIITGDASLRKRPMKRVTAPLRAMGAKIDGREGGDCAPLAIRGGNLRSITYHTPVASAQIKSAILLAGLYAEGVTEVIEPALSRDHTERMLKALGAHIETKNTMVRVQGFSELESFSLFVPGDISSAAFFVVGGAIIPDSEVMIRHVGINPLRTGILDVLKNMGADISLGEIKEEGGEKRTDIIVKSSLLKGVEISGDLIPRTIDELPILAVAASQAEGTTIIRDAKELRVKETDRIKTMAEGLRRFGVQVEEFEDGMAITGPQKLKGTRVSSYGDHRVAMAFIIAGLTASGETIIEDTAPMATSFPNFMELLDSLSQ
jgi:3-phosphoshikimate 1-carboxyvinyltransferase